MYVILRGRVTLYHSKSDTYTLAIKSFNDGESFGELPALTNEEEGGDINIREYTAITCEDCDFLEID